MRSKVGDASDGIALHFYVGTEHLTYEGLEPAQLDNEQLILSWSRAISGSNSEESQFKHTVHGQVA
jgi:hypothetical protein